MLQGPGLLLYERGYTVVSAGWQFDVPRDGKKLALDAPVATDDGKPIRGTVRGQFIPDKRVTRFIVSRAARAMSLPVPPEPVKEILLTSGCELSAAPTISPRPLRTLITPGGNPASCSASVTICVWIALNSLGLITVCSPRRSPWRACCKLIRRCCSTA